MRETAAQVLPPRPAVFTRSWTRYLGVTPLPIQRPRWTVQSRERRGRWGGEETESECTGVGGDTPESQEACSQELFSSQEEDSQSQQLELVGEEEAEERVPVSLTSTSNIPALSQTAEKLQNLRRKPRKSKEDLVKAVMNQSARESKRLQDWREKIQQWRETQSRRKELAKKKSTKQLISLLVRQTDCMQSLVAMQAEHYHADRPSVPKLSPLCLNVSSKPPSPASRFLPPPAAPNTCTFTYQP
ncbi:uncharacterized protein LOC127047271 [Gopherus flavomarginatus]|uniref:uncharacterized protein LOC127047271 n=1 Tax=Gopherus flavomarginatus TaxID=286002 RepID=UPI0021CC4B80|nr:uncharacterized protein LOC127047271 [Gopherus flavomarginatus]